MELRAGYKQTEVGVIPEDWEIKSLESLGTVIRGASPRPKNDKRFYGGDVPRLMVEDVTRDKKFVTPRIDFLTVEGSKRSRPCKSGTLTIVCSGTPAVVGLPSFLAVDACIHDGMLALINLSTEVDSDYLFHRLTSYQEQLFTAATHGGTFVNLTTAGLKAFAIALPPLPEQRAIATALSDMDTLLDALDLLIAKKRDLKQAAMQQLLTGQTRLPGFTGEWEVTTLGEIGECVIGLTYKPENVVAHGLLVLRSSNIQNGQLVYEDNVFVNINVTDHLVTRVGDILVCVRDGSRALIGKCAVIDEKAKNLTFGAFMSVYRTAYWRFVAHAFQAYDIQRQIRENMGATINQITNKDMKALRLKLPGMAEQTAIATVLSDMDAEIAALEQRRDKTRALKQAMMQELLTGKTRLIPKEEAVD